MSNSSIFPTLPLEEWEDTKNTLHLYLQIIGKIRLKTFPKMNHWWHVPFYITSRGIATRPIPHEDLQFEMSFDFIDHVFSISTTEGQRKNITLKDGLSVSEFYTQVFTHLDKLGIHPKIWAVPYDIPEISDVPFQEDTTHKSYDREHVTRFWSILYQLDSVFQEFRGKFTGKSTPPHIFWHHFDFTVTRFSGRSAAVREGANIVESEAYSHEVLSFGFWAGDVKMREPAFYAYAYPVPEGLYDEPIKPEKAFWNREAGMALYMYNDMRWEADPRQAVMEFLDSVYKAGAKCAKWDIDAFRLPE
jgi:hypothetical protein